MSMFRTVFTWLVMFVFIAALAWCAYNLTPLMRDDIGYHFVINEKGISSVLPESWQQAWDSACNIRLIHNGRIGNALFVLFAYLGSKPFYDIINAGMVGVFVLLSSLWVFRKVAPWTVFLVMAVYLLMLVYPSRTIFWAAAAFNYLWGSVFLVCFLYFSRKWEEKATTSWRLDVCVALFAFLCACSHEALGVPMLVGIVLYHTWLYVFGNTRPSGLALLVCVALVAGLVFVFSAPGFLGRLAGRNPSASGSFIQNIIYSSGLYVYSCWLSLLVFLLAFFKRFQWNKEHVFWISVILPSVGVSCCFGLQGSWGGAFYYTTLLMSLFLLQKWGGELIAMRQWCKWVTCISVAVCLVCFFVKQRTICRQCLYAMQQANSNTITVIDGYSESDLPDWVFYGALPYGCEDTLASNQLKQLYRLHPEPSWHFYTIFNVYIKDRSIYEEMSHLPGDRCQSMYRGRYHIVRMPEDHAASIYNNAQFAVTHSGERVRLNVYWFTKAQIAPALRLLGKKEGKVGEDFYKGYHYLIIPDKKREYAEVSLVRVNLKTGNKKQIFVSLNAEN